MLSYTAIAALFPRIPSIDPSDSAADAGAKSELA
jgi:hypothetical protein